MECFLTCWDGRTVALPDLLSWKFTYTTGTPCDAFWVECLWEEAFSQDLSYAIRFYAQEEGETVFYGVVDEYTCQWDGTGGTLEINGRGMAALLLDNEALGVDYLVATFEDILRDHVTPYGIEVVQHVSLPSVAEFSVDNGSSEWQALYEFARYYGGVTPRFDQQGRLVIGDGTVTRRILKDAGGVLSLSYREKRYGVLSEIWVRDRTTQSVEKVLDEDFIAQGGCCRRVLTMPGKSTYQAMRYSGAYQIACAKEEKISLELTLAQPFAATVRDEIEIALEAPNIQGTWTVEEMETGVDEDGTYTTLTLGEG